MIMCSNTCECDELEKNRLEQDIKKEYLCRKCASTSPYVFLDKNLIECQECFLASCNKKIRSTIGKSRLLHNGDRILIAHSGGPSSSALLDLIQRSITLAARREQKFRVSIVHIDIQSTLAREFSVDNQTRIHNLKSLLKSTHENYPDWNIYFSLIELATHSPNESPIFFKFDTVDDLVNTKHLDNLLTKSNSDCLKTFEKNASQLDSTDKIEYYQNCVMNLIDRIGLHINKTEVNESDRIKFVFTGSSATQLANNLLVNVILGQGSTLQQTVNICDQRPMVPIVRPMKEFSKKDIAFYLKARGIQCHPQINFSTLTERKSSIQKTTEAFLAKLNVDFPSTYNVLLKTGNKMQV